MSTSSESLATTTAAMQAGVTPLTTYHSLFATYYSLTYTHLPPRYRRATRRHGCARRGRRWRRVAPGSRPAAVASSKQQVAPGSPPAAVASVSICARVL
eukprot:528563-Prymnesium_polylepis.1